MTQTAVGKPEPSRDGGHLRAEEEDSVRAEISSGLDAVFHQQGESADWYEGVCTTAMPVLCCTTSWLFHSSFPDRMQTFAVGQY